MNLEKPYSTSKVIDNWYQQKPYTFVFTDKNGKKHRFNLPIAPSNLSINTNFATHVISTMYGTIEEHSEQRYFDIMISGTTGIAPRYYNVTSDKKQGSTPSTGRKGFEVKKGINTGGFLQRTKDLINNTLNQAADLLGSEKKPQNAINKEATGYAAFHNFYKFLLEYKKDVTSKNVKRRNHPLQFINYKDNNQYDVSISGFQLTRDYSNPMLYNYNITLRGYNLREADEVDSRELVDTLSALGLGGIETSLKANIANKAKQAKNVAYSAIAAVKGFGR